LINKAITFSSVKDIDLNQVKLQKEEEAKNGTQKKKI
jgi:hypothetical protein